MAQFKRRELLKIGTALGVGLMSRAYATTPQAQLKRSATDWVKLGKSNIRVTRLAFGTGTRSRSIQRQLGQEGFTSLVRYAYDRGIRFFESADSYGEMHEMLATALKGIDRSTYKLMTKIRMRNPEDLKDVQKTLDRFRKELNTDYFDIMLMHCLRTYDWPTTFKGVMDQLEQIKSKQVILAHGASCHGLRPLHAMPGVDWLDVALVRVNHNGLHMDGNKGNFKKPGHRDEAVETIKKIHTSGTGVIGMKLIVEGQFVDPEQRDASIKYVMNLDCVDAVTIGYKSSAEIDEAITRMNKHLNA